MSGFPSPEKLAHPTAISRQRVEELVNRYAHARAMNLNGGHVVGQRLREAFIDDLVALSGSSVESSTNHVPEVRNMVELARQFAASVRPNSTWAKRVLAGHRDDDDAVRSAMAALNGGPSDD